MQVLINACTKHILIRKFIIYFTVKGKNKKKENEKEKLAREG